MNPRAGIQSLLVAAGFLLAALPARAGAPAACPASRGRERALEKIGGRTFARDGGRLRETSVTHYCLSCHDGSVGRLILPGVPTRNRAVPLGSASLAAHGLPDGSHPVDVPYPVGRTGFRPLPEVETTLPLPGRRVTCETCHSGDAGDASHLTVTLQRSRLCLTCHDK